MSPKRLLVDYEKGGAIQVRRGFLNIQACSGESPSWPALIKKDVSMEETFENLALKNILIDFIQWALTKNLDHSGDEVIQRATDAIQFEN